LTKKLEKKSSEASNKDSGDEDSNKESNRNKEFDDVSIRKKESMLHSMSAEHIQSLIANVIKAQLGEGSCKINSYKKPYTKRIDLLHMLQGY